MADRAHGPGTLTYDPAADAAERYPDWVVAVADLGGLVPEVLCWVRQVILLDIAERPEVQRSSLAHAVAHLDLGHAQTLPGFFENREEAQADSLAARRLISIEAFAEAVLWAQDRPSIAAALGVYLEMLEARERDLSRAERRRLRRRCSAVAYA
jgi:hypothetical protein